MEPSSIEYAPPPYEMVTFDSLHLWHTKPSTLNFVPFNETASNTRFGGGTTGTNPELLLKDNSCCGGACCANVEVWFPSSNMQTAPSMNDPRARATFDIMPPRSDRCGEWMFHYGENRQGLSVGAIERVGQVHNYDC